ncbi:hypothetical protein MRB53_010256 [Persea americana]|uniref:Uncharacterized protein n=1 Tax=Persea americana TaxID=3435 RepID=A0ACC2LRG0_PERAE|nr:hypothetical protein MRB53_010256 [Persea americana]
MPPSQVAVGLRTQLLPPRDYGWRASRGPISIQRMASGSGPGCRRVRHSTLASRDSSEFYTGSGYRKHVISAFEPGCRRDMVYAFDPGCRRVRHVGPAFGRFHIRGHPVGPTSIRRMASNSGSSCRGPVVSASEPGTQPLLLSQVDIGPRSPTSTGYQIEGVPWALFPSGAWPLPSGQVAVGTRPLPPRDSGEFTTGSGMQVMPPRDFGLLWAQA